MGVDQRGVEVCVLDRGTLIVEPLAGEQCVDPG
jgi:hypothetical protein